MKGRAVSNGLGLSLLLASSLTGQVWAGQTEVDDFQRRAKALGQSITEDASGNSERCQDLLHQIEQSRGKPQRRYTLMQTYEAECRRHDNLMPNDPLR